VHFWKFGADAFPPVRLVWIISVFGLLFAAAAGGALYFYSEMNAELQIANAAEQRMLEEVERAERRVAEQARVLDRLRNDPVFIEHTIRQRLNFVRPGEVVFRFRED
jgi:cell division protein FtsB